MPWASQATPGKGMGHMTASVAAPDGPMALVRKSPRKESPYVPPRDVGEIMLSEALRGTDRFPEPRQLALMEEDRTANGRADLRLYYAGDLALLKQPCVAIVGTRQVSEAGIKRTRRLVRELVSAGVVVVSGLAYGVDTVAHTTAIETGGRTIAVIGTPLDKASPAESKRLQEEIYREHLLISQFAEESRVFPSNFPQRNKLMATLTNATVVMEASDTSGTLHQAAECTRLKRWLFIAKSAVDDPALSWPKDFLRYETCVPLGDVSDITSRILMLDS